MKNVLKALVAVVTLTSSVSFADELSLICLSAKKSDQNIYKVTIAEDKMVSIPEESFSEVPEVSYFAVVEIIGQEGMVILNSNEFAAKAKPSKLHPNAYKFKDLKNKANYNCEIEQIATTQPGVIRVN